MVDNIRIAISSIPQYMWSGLIELLVTVIGGIIVGYITSHYLYKINEINKVEGWLLTKRIPIYEALYKKADIVMELNQIPLDSYNLCVSELISAGLTEIPKERQLSRLFVKDINFSNFILQLDKFIGDNKLFLDGKVANELTLFQNYNALLNRIILLFDEQMIQYKINDKYETQKVRQNLLICLGLYLTSEYLNIVMHLQNTIRISVNNLRINYRRKPDYSYDYFISEKGYLMSKMKNLKALEQREHISQLVIQHVAKALVLCGVKQKDGL